MMTMSWVFCVIFPALASCSQVAMKVVDSPISYGINNDLIAPHLNSNPLSPLISPANFSGPSLLRGLLGRCFNYSDDNYLYALCPFDNVTQVELSNRWNAYQGILGIWREWKIINNTFSSMMMLDGDKCSNKHRLVEVILECNRSEGIREVAEPSQCSYLIIFDTPLVCHNDSLLVYPRLPVNLRHQWDQLETELNYGFLTQLGYEDGLRQIFITAGFMQSRNSVLVESSNDTNTTSFHNTITSLSECLQEVNELRNEIEGMKILVELKNLNDASVAQRINKK